MSVVLTARKIAAMSRSFTDIDRADGAGELSEAAGAAGLEAGSDGRKYLHADSPSTRATPATRTRPKREEAIDTPGLKSAGNLFTWRNDGVRLRWMLALDERGSVPFG